MDYRARAHDQSQVAAARPLHGPIHRRGRQGLAEPDHRRTKELPAAVAGRGCMLAQRPRPVLPLKTTPDTADPEEIAVEGDHLRRRAIAALGLRGNLVEAVDVLGDEERRTDPRREPRRQGSMPGIGPTLRNQGPAPRVPPPHACGIRLKGSGRGEILGPIPFPEAALAPEGRHLGFRRDASAGKDQHACGSGESGPRLSQWVVQGAHQRDFGGAQGWDGALTRLHAAHAQPAIRSTPPTGVTAPRMGVSVSTRT